MVILHARFLAMLLYSCSIDHIFNHVYSAESHWTVVKESILCCCFNSSLLAILDYHSAVDLPFTSGNVW